MIRSFKKGVAGKPGFGKDFAAYYEQVLPDPRAESRRKEIVADGYRLAPLLVEGWRGFKRADEDLRPLIGKVTCPVLFTWAMKDRYVRFSRNRKAIARFPDHRLLEYPIGHTPYLECPETFLADLREFVAQPPAAIR
jgi:pimeloyl-ACP methyl ester carboxylesterase